MALGVLPTGPRMLREAGSMYYAAVPVKHVRRQLTRRSGHGLAVGPAGLTACPPGVNTCSSRDGAARVTGPAPLVSGAGGCAIVRSQ